MTCCCNPRPSACKRVSYLQVDGVAAVLDRLPWFQGSFYEGDRPGVDLGNFAFGNALKPRTWREWSYYVGPDQNGTSGLFSGTGVGPYYGTDWIWLQWNTEGRGAPLSDADNLVWEVTKNDDRTGVTDKNWSFRGILITDAYTQHHSNHCYVVRFEWKQDGVPQCADIYMPEHPVRDWDTQGKGLDGPWVMHNGRKYTADSIRGNVFPPDPFDPFENEPEQDNDFYIATIQANVQMVMAWKYEDTDATTTTAAGTTTTDGKDRWRISAEWRPSGKYDFLCHVDKGTESGLVPVIGQWQYRSDCDEVQRYSVDGLNSVTIHKHQCSEYATEYLGQSYGRDHGHNSYLSPQDAACAEGSTTTTSEGWDTLAFREPCDLECIGSEDETVWETPVDCLYRVQAHNKTWTLTSDQAGRYPRSRARRFAATYFRTFTWDRSPIAHLSVYNRIVSGVTEPWVVLKLGVTVEYPRGFFSKQYFSFWLAAYGYRLDSTGTVDSVRGGTTMSRFWQYGEDIHKCNDIELLDWRKSEQHHYHGYTPSFSGSPNPQWTSGWQFYQGVTNYTVRTNGDPWVHLDVGEWLTGTSSFTSFGGTVTVYADYPSVPSKFDPVPGLRFLTDPERIKRGHCTVMEVDPADQTAINNLTAGDYSVTFKEYWLDMPATVDLEAL